MAFLKKIFYTLDINFYKKIISYVKIIIEIEKNKYIYFKFKYLFNINFNRLWIILGFLFYKRNMINNRCPPLLQIIFKNLMLNTQCNRLLLLLQLHILYLKVLKINLLQYISYFILSLEEKESLRITFDKLDKNGDGNYNNLNIQR